jgi:hypothetical protein
MPAICINCKNVIDRCSPDDDWENRARYICKTGKINYVTGKDEVQFCANLNHNGECERFISKE